MCAECYEMISLCHNLHNIVSRNVLPEINQVDSLEQFDNFGIEANTMFYEVQF